jgi:hypothetical protein
MAPELRPRLGAVESEVYAQQRVNQLHRLEREPMPESAE